MSENLPPSALADAVAQPLADDEIGTTRGALDRALIGTVRALLRHWLLVVNASLGVFAGLPFLAPYLAARGYFDLATLIFSAYSLTCHQMPSRSFFLFGEQMPYCQRNTAIYTGLFLAGLAFSQIRHRLRPLPWHWYGILIFPMALDGFTQLFELRESTWELRVLTGSLFAIASIWLTFPYLERTAREVEAEFAAVAARPDLTP